MTREIRETAPRDGEAERAAEAWLRQVGEAARRVKEIRSRIELLRMIRADTAAKLCPVPGRSGGAESKMERLTAEIMSLEQELGNAQRIEAERREAAALAISRLADDTVRKVMTLHWLNGMNWTEIAAELGISRISAYRARQSGLRQLRFGDL